MMVLNATARPEDAPRIVQIRGSELRAMKDMITKHPEKRRFIDARLLRQLDQMEK